MQRNQDIYIVVLFLRADYSARLLKAAKRQTLSLSALDPNAPTYPPKRMLRSLGTEEEIVGFHLNGQSDPAQEMIDYFEGSRASCAASDLLGELAREEIECCLAVTLRSGNRKWVERRIDPGMLSDARDRFLPNRQGLQVLPEVGVLIFPRWLNQS